MTTRLRPLLPRRRTRRTFALTAAGKRIAASAERMEEAAAEVATRAIDDAGMTSGTVRIATTDSLAEGFIDAVTRAFRARVLRPTRGRAPRAPGA